LSLGVRVEDLERDRARAPIEIGRDGEIEV